MLLGWWRDARPVAPGDAPAGRLECLSYAPSGAGATMPRDVAPARIRADLASLAAITGCVRTYTVSDGFDAVPGIARELGLRVWLGAWIGRDAAHNERELARVIAVANTHRDVVRGVIVGNEVLLRHEQTPAALTAMIRRVRAATDLPVTYADVWGFWLKHPELGREVGFVTVHILPYWDDEPAGIDTVVPHVLELYDDMRTAFPGRQVLIGETGWPSVGRPRGAAVPSRVNQARYLREFTAAAHARGIPYNIIEAFDQPWKQPPEGTVGGYWGLHDVAGRPKFPWRGALSEAPHASRVLLASTALALVGFCAGFIGGRRGGLAAALLLAASGALAAAAAARQWQALVAANLGVADWSVTLAVAAAGWSALVLALRVVLRGALAAGAPLRTGRNALPGALVLGLLLTASYACLGLVFAGRHRDFPLWLFLPAVLALVLLALFDARAVARDLLARRATLELVLASWIAAAGIAVPLLEDFGSGRALAFGASMLALGLAVLAPIALEARDHPGSRQHARR